MKKYKIYQDGYGFVEPYYEESYIPEGGWVIINILWHIFMGVIIYKMI